MAYLKRWVPLLRIPIALASVALFFSIYNRFLLDSNLRNLKNSLSVLDAATGVGQAEAALLLVDQTLTAEMVKEALDLQSVGVLQYAQGALGSEFPDRSPVDAQALVATLTQEREAERVGALAVLDTFSSRFQRAVSKVTLLPRGKPKKAFGGIDQIQLSEAIHRERNGALDGAAELYRELIESYPDYSSRPTLKLRLGSLMQRTQKFEEAQRLYREALKESQDPKDLATARALLEGLADARKQQAAAAKLEQKLPSLGAGPEHQKALLALGSLQIRLSSFDKAARTFRAAAQADPESDRAPVARFKEAWCLKSMGRLEEATKLFHQLASGDPNSSWAGAAQQQLAEIFKTQGNHLEALMMYDAMITGSKDNALVALALSQAGATALYDLHDPEKSRRYFAQLQERFPGSPFSDAGNLMHRLEASKASVSAEAAAKTAGSGSLLFGWIEKTLPTFVQAFADRLARYMETVEETSLTRRFTEEEFRKVVLRRVEELLPNQIQAVDVHIHPNGYTGSSTVRLGPVYFSVAGRVSVKVVNKRPHVVLHEMKIWGLPVPEGMLKQIAERSNKVIDGLRLPIDVLEYEFKEGYVVIHVERVR